MLLLAVMHALLLADPTHPLAAWYPTLTNEPRPHDDPELDTTVAAFLDEHTAVVIEQLGWRRTQTNEVGRCSFLFAAMAPIARNVGPLAHIDVGTSAGLNLLLPHYTYRFDDDDPIGSGAPLLECSTRDSPQRPQNPLDVASSVGLDSAPLDVSNDADARWLKACVWPDQLDRFERLDAAISAARRRPPEIHTGEANALLADIVTGNITGTQPTGHPVVTTSWVLNYFRGSERTRFMATLDNLGADIDLTWVYAESPAQTPELPHADDVVGEHLTALTTVTWRNGVRTVTPIGVCHPHGYWIRFR